MAKKPTPYGMDIIQGCLTCPVTEDGLFCHLGQQALAELDTMRQTSVYPKGAILFVEGQTADGLFVLCSGKVKLTASYPQGRSIILRVAAPGEVLGLSAALSAANHDASAEVLESAQVNFLPRTTFMGFVERNGEVAVRIAQHLGAELRRAHHQVVRIALAPSARAKLAGWLLDWAGREAQPTKKGTRFQLPLTRQEIGELIGSSRETVSRILADFNRKGLVHVNGSSITVENPSGLEKILS